MSTSSKALHQTKTTYDDNYIRRSLIQCLIPFLRRRCGFVRR